MEDIYFRLTNVISLDEISVFPRDIDDDFFFEEMNNNINRSILSLQQQSGREDKSKICRLGNELSALKLNFAENLESIKVIEAELSDIYECELKDKVQNYVKDVILTNEKMCPKFLQIAKSVNSESMSVIKDGNGQPFTNIKDRGKYIRNFYSNLYKIPDGIEKNLGGCVSRFLGEEICSNPEVIAMKLSNEEKIRLDGNFTLEELYTALKTSNKISAPGIDGVNNKLTRLT